MGLSQSGKWINSYSESHDSICYGLIKLPSNDIFSLHIGIISLHIVGGVEKKSHNFIYLTKLSSRKLKFSFENWRMLEYAPHKLLLGHKVRQSKGRPLADNLLFAEVTDLILWMRMSYLLIFIGSNEQTAEFAIEHPFKEGPKSINFD